MTDEQFVDELVKYLCDDGDGVGGSPPVFRGEDGKILRIKTLELLPYWNLPENKRRELLRED